VDDSQRRQIYDRIRAENEKFIEDYRNRLNSLVRVSQNITRMSPVATFTFLATDIMGTGMAEERRLKRAVLQYLKDTDGQMLDYHRSSVKEVLDRGGLSNCLILILFNILFFSGTYVAFLKYDVR
jgi:hypothetical protein